MTSTTGWSLDESCMPLRTKLPNPDIWTSIWYRPGARNGIVYWPDASATVAVLVPVRTSVAVTLAPAIFAPDWSDTDPLMVPRNSCARAPVEKRKNTAIKNDLLDSTLQKPVVFMLF